MGHPARRFGDCFGCREGLVRGHHGVVELFEECVVYFLSILFGETKRLDAFDEDFGCVGLGPDEFDSLGEVVFERHGAGVGSLLAAHQFGLDVRWDEF